MNWKKESQKQKQKGKKAGKAERKTKEVGKQNKNQIKKSIFFDSNDKKLTFAKASRHKAESTKPKFG